MKRALGPLTRSAFRLLMNWSEGFAADSEAIFAGDKPISRRLLVDLPGDSLVNVGVVAAKSDAAAEEVLRFFNERSAVHHGGREGDGRQLKAAIGQDARRGGQQLFQRAGDVEVAALSARHGDELTAGPLVAGFVGRDVDAFAHIQQQRLRFAIVDGDDRRHFQAKGDASHAGLPWRLLP